MLPAAAVYDSLVTSRAFDGFNVLLYEFGVDVSAVGAPLDDMPQKLPTDATADVAQDIIAALRMLAYLPNDEELAAGSRAFPLHLVACSMTCTMTLVIATMLPDAVETVTLLSPLLPGLTVRAVRS